MPKYVVLFLCVVSASQAAIWPERLAGSNRTDVKPLKPPAADQAIWEEYGFDEGEAAVYGKWSGQAWRLKDSTSAAAAFEWQRPEGAKSWKIEGVSTNDLAVESGDVAVLAFGNYLLCFQGKKPLAADLAPFFHQLPRLDQSSLPPLLAFLPEENRVANSERYILGPPSLARFRPGLSPATVGFSVGAEGEISRFREQKGEVELCLFYYPSSQIARSRLPDFEKIGGAMVKRAGPLIALVLNPADRDDAERLLSRINYKATVTWSEPAPGSQLRQMGSLLYNTVLFSGILLFFCLVAGLALGGARVFGRKITGNKAVEEPMTLLHLGDR